MEMVGEGRWPFDMDFFYVHAPALVIGGASYASAVRAMARNLPETAYPWQVDDGTMKLDAYATVNRQLNTAETRVKNFLASGNVADLYSDRPGGDDVYPVVRAVMMRFNQVMANHLGVELPPAERPTVNVSV